MIFLAFAPFIVFAIAERFVGGPFALAAGAIASAVLLARDWISRKRSLKVLEIGTFVLFAGLTVYAYLSGATWAVFSVRLKVDGCLFLIVLLSMLLGRPFTLQYAREQVPTGISNSPEFFRTNYIITAVWAAAFLIMTAIDAVMIYLPGTPHQVGILVTIAAIYGAYRFTQWYPTRRPKAVP
jgi:hypothetical protein